MKNLLYVERRKSRLGIAERIKKLVSVVNIQKEILSEIDFYQGTIKYA
jgi:hypothetical protein